MSDLELSRELFVREEGTVGAREGIARPSITYSADAWRRLKQNKVAMIGLGVLLLMTLVAIVAPMISKDTYQTVHFTDSYKVPNKDYWFGTDSLGRDLWVRVWYGGRVSLFIGVAAAVLNLIVGGLYGGIAGYTGGRVDDFMMRIIEIVNGLPDLLILIMLRIVLGGGISTVILVMAMLSWTGMARLVRGQVLQLKEQEFVLAARTLGATPIRIIVQHLLPNAMGPILVNLTLAVPGAIFFEAALSFIGLGINPPQPSWGILAEGGRQELLNYPHMLLYPALAIALAMLAFNLFGDGLRDALDPRLRGKD